MFAFFPAWIFLPSLNDASIWHPSAASFVRFGCVHCCGTMVHQCELSQHDSCHWKDQICQDQKKVTLREGTNVQQWFCTGLVGATALTNFQWQLHLVFWAAFSCQEPILQCICNSIGVTMTHNQKSFKLERISKFEFHQSCEMSKAKTEQCKTSQNWAAVALCNAPVCILHGIWAKWDRANKREKSLSNIGATFCELAAAGTFGHSLATVGSVAHLIMLCACCVAVHLFCLWLPDIML